MRFLNCTVYLGAIAVMALALLQPAFAAGGCNCGSCSGGCQLYGEGGTNNFLCLCQGGSQREFCKPTY